MSEPALIDMAPPYSVAVFPLKVEPLTEVSLELATRTLAPSPTVMPVGHQNASIKLIVRCDPSGPDE